MNDKQKISFPDLSFFKFDNSYVSFDGIISFLAGVCANSYVLDSSLGNSELYKEKHYIFFEGRANATNKIYYFFPYDIFNYLTNNEWPKQIKLYYKEKSGPYSEESKKGINGFSQVFMNLGQAMYIQFWESIKSKIIKTFGKDHKIWPSLFLFGWIIRNALAHNFKIMINNPEIDKVEWNNLSYGFSNSGINISDEIMFIELIVLMREIEDQLR